MFVPIHESFINIIYLYRNLTFNNKGVSFSFLAHRSNSFEEYFQIIFKSLLFFWLWSKKFIRWICGAPQICRIAFFHPVHFTTFILFFKGNLIFFFYAFLKQSSCSCRARLPEFRQNTIFIRAEIFQFTSQFTFTSFITSSRWPPASCQHMIWHPIETPIPATVLVHYWPMLVIHKRIIIIFPGRDTYKSYAARVHVVMCAALHGRHLHHRRAHVHRTIRWVPDETKPWNKATKCCCHGEKWRVILG